LAVELDPQKLIGETAKNIDALNPQYQNQLDGRIDLYLAVTGDWGYAFHGFPLPP
jgi:hypothetical protein